MPLQPPTVFQHRPGARGRPGACRPGWLALTLAGLLSACGGGGGGEASAPAPLEVPVGLRVEAASAGADLRADALASQGAALAQALMFTIGNPLTSAAFSVQAAPVAMLATAGGDLLRRALRADTPRVQPGSAAQAVASLTEACLLSGSLSLQVDDTDDDGSLGPGDVIRLQALSCVTTPGAPALEGTFALTIERIEQDAGGLVTAVQARGTMAGLAVGSAGTLDGGFRMWMRHDAAAGERLRMRYEDMLLRRPGQDTLLLDFDVLTLVSSVEALHTLSGGLVLGGLTYRLEPEGVAPLVLTTAGGLPGSFYEPGRDVWPHSGAVRLLDAARDALVLRARPDALVDLEFWPAGSAEPSAWLRGQPWSRFLPAPG